MKTNYPIERFVESIDDYSEIPEKISEGIKITVEDFEDRFNTFDDAQASQKPQPDKWSRKEILGHLIDSAANNHQRFVRAQYLKEIVVPSYEQKEWVHVQQYINRPWSELLALWKTYNFHLAYIISHMEAEHLKNMCIIGSGAPVTVGFVAADYLGHMQHHIKQIEKM
ncbi:MAG: DinB family protein [Ignavibacteriae bacterium]|nr:MAG: DinB family protein [Ignavibacteriota bacterium]